MEEKIKVGDILLESGKSWLARKIQQFQDNKYNHAGIVFDNGGELCIAEATAKGFVPAKLAERLGDKSKEFLVCRPVFWIDRNEVNQHIIYMLGQHRYDFKGLLVDQLVYTLSKKVGKEYWIGRTGGKADKRLYCSEAVLKVYNDLYGIFPKCFRTPPSEIAEMQNMFRFFQPI